MTTFADIKSAIADDVDDTTGEYGAQIETAVLAAIRYCGRSEYYFNQTRDKTFSTVADQEFYTSSDLADIASLVHAAAAFASDGTRTWELKKTHPEEIEERAGTASSNRPELYSYFAQEIRLYPVPDAAYTIRLQLSPYRLDALSAASDTNAWLTEAYDLVKARAKYILLKDTLKDAALATEALNDYNDQHRALKKETDKRNGTGFVTPSEF